MPKQPSPGGMLSIPNRVFCAMARGGITLYQWIISPALHVLLGSRSGCRHTPSCSRYAKQCFERLPFHRALWLSLKRISRCHPWGTEGDDPAPNDYSESD